MLGFEEFTMSCYIVICIIESYLHVFLWAKRKKTVLARCPCFFFLPGLQHIKCLGHLQRNSKQAKHFPLSDPVSLSQGRRHSGDSSCVKQSCYIGDNAQQELWNVPWSLSETFYQHALLISNMCTRRVH